MPDRIERKRRAMHTWGTGAYSDVGQHFLPAIARLVDAAAVGTGDRVLDVACGPGNLALTAHRRSATVVGVDLAPAMLGHARENAAVVDAEVAWHNADAEALPYADGAFDAVLSNVGHFVAPDPGAAGAELVRVAAPGGRIAYTAWLPDGPLPAIYEALDPYLPADPDAPDPPHRWSDPAVASERLGPGAESLATEDATVTIPAVSVPHFWSYIVACSGPLQDTLDSVPAEDRTAARDDVLAALEPYFDASRNQVGLPYRLVSARKD